MSLYDNLCYQLVLAWDGIDQLDGPVPPRSRGQEEWEETLRVAVCAWTSLSPADWSALRLPAQRIPWIELALRNRSRHDSAQRLPADEAGTPRDQGEPGPGGKPTPAHEMDELPAPTDEEARRRVADALESWKRIIYAPPGEKPTLQEHVRLTNAVVAWRDRHAPHFDVTPLDEVRRILVRRAAGETTPEEELRAAGERAARACDRIKDWLQTIGDLLEEKTAGYSPSTELSEIVFELNNPPSDLPPNPGEPVEVPNPFDVERRRWLPILKECIGKIPELAGDLTEAKLRQWLRRKYKVPPTQDLIAEQLVALLEREHAERAADQPAEPPAEEKAAPPTKKAKRSTERGEGRAKLIAALTAHHRYANGGCLNLEPIGNNELARRAEVSPSTAKDFFDKEFGGPERERGHAKYKVVCRDAGRLFDSLKALNGEFSPHDLYGRRPPGEGERDEDE